MKKVFINLLFAMVIFNITCKKSTEPATQPCSPFTGITETDATGNIYGNTDTDDWQSSGILIVYPAYPNPFYPVCTFHFNLTDSAALKVTVNDNPDRIVRTFPVFNLPAGNHRIIWDGRNDSDEFVWDCIYRVYFSATANGITYQTYGDVKVKTK